jgi:hypothetical protein
MTVVHPKSFASGGIHSRKAKVRRSYAPIFDGYSKRCILCKSSNDLPFCHRVPYSQHARYPEAYRHFASFQVLSCDHDFVITRRSEKLVEPKRYQATGLFPTVLFITLTGRLGRG